MCSVVALPKRSLCFLCRAGARYAGVIRRPVVPQARYAGVILMPLVLSAASGQPDRVLSVVQIEAGYARRDPFLAWYR